MTHTDKGLLPCPFCGGVAGINTCRTSDREFLRMNGWDSDTGYGVNCIVCGVNNRGIAYGFRTKEQAVEAWNRRADTAGGK